MRPAGQRLRRLVGLLTTSVALAGCSTDARLSFLAPQGPVAAAERWHFWWIVALTMIAVAPVLLLTPWLVWRYRYRGGASYRPNWSFSWALEGVIWGGPFLVVGVLGWLLWHQTLALDPYKPLDSNQPVLQVQVIGFDWKWLFIYPDQHIATLGRLVIPAGRPVAFELTSASVLQTFFIPALGSQIDVMNRMITRLHLQADRPGRFLGRNMQYNGKGFQHQHFIATALSPRAFHAFVDRAQRQGMPLGAGQYQALVARSTASEAVKRLTGAKDKNSLTFSSVPSGLFEAVARPGPIDWNALTRARPGGHLPTLAHRATRGGRP